MNENVDIEADPLVFDKLLAPLDPLLEQLDQEPQSQAAEKLGFRLFVRLLLFRLFARIQTLRDLQRDLKTNQTARQLGFPVLGLSTIHDAFVRYRVAWVVRLSQYLMQTRPLPEIPELEALGPLWCGDSSWWPLPRQLGWLAREGLQGVRLHLMLSLNHLCPVLLLVTLDAAASSSERQCVLQLVQAGVTVILDRGYVDVKLYLELMARQAFFVIRERNNLRYRVLAQIPVCLGFTAACLSSVSDQVINLNRDDSGTVYRLVRFVAAGHQFHLLTNRWDLSTQQIIMLYAWRWQVELIFRAWKHTLGALHAINLSEGGLQIQFHILLIASLLWVTFQHQATQLAGQSQPEPVASAPTRPARTPTAVFSALFRVSWRFLKPVMQVLKNCLAHPLSFYLKQLVQLRL